jgi:antitoxin component YwqK of YwqJK toxin-antitoxin module
MKKFITYIILTCLSAGALLAQTIEEKEKQLFKKYHVKERTKINYNYVDGKQSSQGVKTSTSTYDAKGQVLETRTFGRKGEVITVEKFGYDQNGNRTLYERTSMTGEYKKKSEYNEEDNIVLESGYDGSAKFKTVYVYSSQGKVSEIKYYVDNMLDEKRVYEYNGDKAVVKILHQGKTLKSKVNLVFNDNGDILEEVILSLDGKELEKRILTYAGSGKPKTEEKHRGGKFNYKLTYYYNSNGDLVKLHEESPSKGNLDKKLYTYDAEGRIIEYKWKRKPDDKYNSKTYKYGSDGVCVEEFTFYPKTNYKLLSKYTYKF